MFKVLNPSYGLKVIEFQSLNQFKWFFWISFIIYLNIIQNIIHNIIQNSADMWDPHVSLCLFIKPLIKSENGIGPTCQWLDFINPILIKQNDRWGRGVIDSSVN